MPPTNHPSIHPSIRPSTPQGKGEYSMEYSHHAPVTKDLQDELTTHYQKNRATAK